MQKRNRDDYLKVMTAGRHYSAMPTSKTGAIHELLVCADLMRCGYSVYRALSPAEKCDLLAIKDGKMVRVEVTTGFQSRGGSICHPQKENPNGERFDLLAVVMKSWKITYYPPISEPEFTPTSIRPPTSSTGI
jgi:hypothetical protein